MTDDQLIDRCERAIRAALECDHPSNTGLAAVLICIEVRKAELRGPTIEDLGSDQHFEMIA